MNLKISRLVFSLLPVAALAFGGSTVPPTRPSLPQEEVLAKGLQAWRRPGAIDHGAACATCHSPDGIELAAFAFSDVDIKRRALPHLGDPDSQLLLEYIHALRAKLNIEKPLDPMAYRPLQPGGDVLPGETPAQRDEAFGEEVRSVLPTLMGKRIETLEQARAAEKELLQVDVQSLKIGIPFSRLSEDGAHGPTHASIAEWLPEVPPMLPPESQSAWYAKEDAYLANPSDATLQELLKTHESLVNSSRLLGLGAISVAKFRALLVYQDKLRRHSEAKPTFLDPLIAESTGFNAFWEVGEECRGQMGHTAEQLGFDAASLQKKTGAVTLADQMHQLRAAWFWLGWLSDQGQFQTSHDDKTRLGMWLSQSLSQDGPYPIHSVFANARRQAVITNDLASWTEPVIRRRRIWDFAGLRSFGFHFRDLPEEPNYRKMTIGFTANCFRMSLLLFREEIVQTKSVWVKISSKSNVKELTSFIKQYDPDDRDNIFALEDDLLKLIDGAKERNQYSPGIAGQ